MGCPFTIRELEEELAERLELLDASPFDQNRDGTRPARWREATVPLSVLEDAGPLEHLLFNVWVERSQNSEERRDQAGQFVKLESSVVVAFLYNLRPSDQLKDARLASDAAHAIARALMSRDLARLVDVRLVDAWRPLLSESGTKLLGAVRFLVAHEIRI